jgi:hypothetical protein
MQHIRKFVPFLYELLMEETDAREAAAEGKEVRLTTLL